MTVRTRRMTVPGPLGPLSVYEEIRPVTGVRKSRNTFHKLKDRANI